MKDKRSYFKAEWDWRVKYITYGFLFFFFIISFILPILFRNGTIFIFLSLAWCLFLLSYFFSPKGYSFDENKISILTRIKKIKIPLPEIKEIKKLEKEDLSGSLRIFGIGGLFGYTGIFYSKKLGFYLSFSTNYNNLIIIKAKKTYIISPENMDLFLEVVKKKI